MQPKLHFSRFEFKYIFRHDERKELERELGYFMALDPYVSAKRGNKYFVRSLYFDDDVYTNYYEKIDGIFIRHKYRIRTYTDDESEDCSTFLEIKGRYNALVYKHRVQLPRSAIKSLENGEREFQIDILKMVNSNEVIKKFCYDNYRMRLKPKILIDYNRRPYISKYAPDFRITFDDSLQATVSKRLFNRITDRRRKFYPGYSIVEIKFKRHIPSWFHRLIQSYELHRISVSKYCCGMEGVDLVDNLE